ncbi:MAG: carbohydrate ABC transporter permease [Lachnospiraceae bacterium]|nr:carbohydrate ABC transporter permease [Lachnospiraceae bacterium]
MAEEYFTTDDKKLARRIRRGGQPHYRRSFSDHVMSFITYVVYTFFAFVCLYPFYYIFINTISNNDLSQRGKVLFYPKEIHFTNYIQVFQIKGLFDAFKISLLRTVIGTVLTVVCAAFLGYMFTRESMWKRRFWYRFVVATMYFNAGIIPWYLTMVKLGLVNNFWGYIFPMVVSPFYIVLCKTFVESIPKELQEAAEIDGAGTLRIFWSIIRPVIKPILATIAIFSAVNQWNAFQDTLLLVTDQKLYSLQFLLYNYINQANSLKTAVNSSTSSANIAASLAHAANATSIRMTVTMFVVIPIILVYPFFQRYFTKGIMIGAVKG